MFGNTRKHSYQEYQCADCKHVSCHPSFAVRQGSRCNRARCPKCGSTFLVQRDEDDDHGLDAQGKSAYVRMMEAQGWTCQQPWPQHVETTYNSIPTA